jgi:hypothetical protein
MNNKQQTAVEWLIEQLHRKYGGTDFFWTNMDEIEQAKEMDKEQAIKFALCYAYGQYNVSEGLRTHIEKFYEQTYRGGEQ